MGVKNNALKGSAMALLVAFSYTANAGERLFQEWEFGTPKAELAATGEYYDCTHDMGMPALCLPSLTFLDQEFEAALLFNKDQLEQVMLVAPYSQPDLMKIIGAVRRNFSMISLKGSVDSFDIVAELRNSANATDFEARMTEFELMQMELGEVAYIFTEQDPNTTRAYASAFEAIRSAPLNTRAAEVFVIDDMDGGMLGVNFTLPQLSHQLMTNQANDAPVEDF